MAPQLSEDEIDDLLYAARVGDKDELTSLLSSLAEREKVTPADILMSAKDEGKSTCLHMAAGNGHAEIVAHLLSYLPAGEAKADSETEKKKAKQEFLDAPNEYGNTGLHWAALGGHLAVVKLLVEHGASVALANDKNYVPLDLASFGDKFDVVDYFLAQSGGLEGDNAEAGGLEAGMEGVTADDVEEGRDSEAEAKDKGKGKKEGAEEKGKSG
ncbi:ankyrin repeat-containing protein YAR1 [Corynascus novoguineensis]|uniref:Ankyrin repeat-containing protein YAR1 n=1 Tax=Corynascus novoguineensis TaxID=1126955 RepID=A0AAN7D071_9PEZI|nr:ankyrin repeat-containing protein YAR1 [Corynascus novoguineensis]